MDFTRLIDIPCYIINLDRCNDRMDKTLERVKNAGFKNIERFRGVDAKNDDLKKEWSKHGSPKFDSDDPDFIKYIGKQGCMLSHLNIWKKMIDEKIETVVVFEDDVEFHNQWLELAPEYIKNTPVDFDILYIGSQIVAIREEHIQVSPVFCTHAYVITLDGAHKIYNLLVNDIKGVKTIDCMIIEHMKSVIFNKQKPAFVWYVWNGTKFIDENASKNKDWQTRNHGLVFQDADFVSEVRIW